MVWAGPSCRGTSPCPLRTWGNRGCPSAVVPSCCLVYMSHFMATHFWRRGRTCTPEIVLEFLTGLLKDIEQKQQGWIYSREYIFLLSIFRKALSSFFRLLYKTLKKESCAFQNIGKWNIYSLLQNQLCFFYLYFLRYLIRSFIRIWSFFVCWSLLSKLNLPEDADVDVAVVFQQFG